MEMNFTIIVPHYNTPLLLGRLINSIPKRDDLELIIVDDHSDSRLVDFEHFPGANRENVTIVRNQDNHGAGFCRNTAIPMAKGKWVLFADSDDFFNDGFDDFLSRYVGSTVDVIYFSANSVDSETYEPSNRADHIHEYMKKYSRDRVVGGLTLRYMFTETVCKMVKRELLHNNAISFDVTSIHEDVKFACSVGHYAKEILVVNEELYCITSRNDSVSRTMSRKVYLDELLVFAKWNKFLTDNHLPFDLPKFDYRLYNMTRHLYKDNGLFCDELKILRKAGYDFRFIFVQIVKNLWKSVGYKWNALIKR